MCSCKKIDICKGSPVVVLYRQFKINSDLYDGGLLSEVSPEVCTPSALRALGQSLVSEPMASSQTSHSDGQDLLAPRATARSYFTKA